MSDSKTIIFVCEHGAAKSVIAAAYFNQLAIKRGLDVRALARGTHPDSALSSAAVAGLRSDGIPFADGPPQKLRRAEVESARKIVTFCELPEEFVDKTATEVWEGVPPVSADYAQARDAILKHLKDLVE